MFMSVAVQEHDFNLSDELALAEANGQDCGAIVSFIGKVRGHDSSSHALDHLFLTHFPEVTETEIQNIIQMASVRWSLSYARVIHRIGQLGVGEQIVLVLTASKHRDDAYQANRFIMDYLKTEAPFWKKECFKDGQAHWVDMKQSDCARIHHWQQS